MLSLDAHDTNGMFKILVAKISQTRISVILSLLT